MKIQALISASFICASLAAGCSDPTTPEVINRQGWLDSNYAATFQIGRYTVHFADSSAWHQDQLSAYLWNSASNVPVDGGGVSINSTPIRRVDYTNEDGGVSYQSNSAANDIVPMEFTGNKLVFSVTGSPAFQALKDSLSYVNEEAAITSPSIYSSISRATGFTLTWPFKQGSTDSIFVQLNSEKGGNNQTVQRFPRDNGSYIIDPTILSRFQIGDTIRITLSRAVTKTGIDHGRKYVMTCFSEVMDDHPLAP